MQSICTVHTNRNQTYAFLIAKSLSLFCLSNNFCCFCRTTHRMTSTTHTLSTDTNAVTHRVRVSIARLPHIVILNNTLDALPVELHTHQRNQTKIITKLCYHAHSRDLSECQRNPSHTTAMLIQTCWPLLPSSFPSRLCTGGGHPGERGSRPRSRGRSWNDEEPSLHEAVRDNHH